MSAARPVVYLHIGAPKTGTTFLQAVLAQNRRSLKAQGLLYPGPGSDHFLAAQDIRGAFKGATDPRIDGAWGRLVDVVARWSGRAALISHETLIAADDREIDRMVADLSEHDVRIVVTARDFTRQLPAVWQEDLKNGRTATLPEFLERVRRGPREGVRPRRGFWFWQDLPRVLGAWERHLPADRITVVTVPPRGAPRDLLWRRFAAAVGVDPDGADLDVARANTSLTAGAAEVLRLLNVELMSDEDHPIDWPSYRRDVKKFLAESVLSAQPGGTPIRIGRDDQAWACDLGEHVATTITERGYRVVGDLSDLVPVGSDADADTPVERSGPAAAVTLAEEALPAAAGALAAVVRRLAQERGGK